MKNNALRRFLHSKTAGLLILTVVLAVVFTIIEPSFVTAGNLRQLMVNLTVPGFMLIAVGPLLISGNMDLAAGAEAALGAMIFAKMVQSFQGVPWVAALLTAAAAGVGFGFVYIFLVNKKGLVSFIASIAMTSVYTGFATMWTRTNNVDINRASFLKLGSLAVGDVVPFLFILMAVLVAACEFWLKNTSFGRSIYMVGGNPYAAKLSGLNQKRIQAILFVISCVFAVLAGIAWCAYKKMASPVNIANSMANFDALTACILGGISFMGGTGGLGGAFAALLLVKVFFNGLTILDLPSYVSVPMQGLVLIVALIVDHFRSKSVRMK